MLPIETKYITYNYTKRIPFITNYKIKYLVIHDTGNVGIGANAIMHFNYFNSHYVGASADYFVDDGRIIQTVDYTKNYSWHVGDGKGAYGITNQNAIGIEICVNSDGDYNKAVANTSDLVAYLMHELNIGIENVVRHYDASRKMCPNSMKENNWQKWFDFKNTVNKKYNDIRFENIIKQYSSSPDYWIENAQEGKTCKGDWVKALILGMFK